MDYARQEIVQKVYLSAIVEHAQRIHEVTRKLQTAREYRQLTGDELATALNTGDLTLYEANVVDHTLSFKVLQDIEAKLQDIVYTVQGCYEV